MKGKSCLISLAAFRSQMMNLVEEERLMDVFYLDFSKAKNPSPITASLAKQ